jgi:Pyruvate/2-oxoacid:ferredoxin oxidoreductase delta subunit
MEGNGPAHGRPSPLGLLLASRDPVALDAVACATLRIPPASVPMIRLAAANSLGSMDVSAIDCVGSGVSRLESVGLKPSFAKYLRHVPEPMFRLSTRFLRLRPKIKNRLCAKCGICIGICPKKTIKKNERSGYPAIDQAGCIDCFCCVESCPDRAIAVQLYLGGIPCIAQKSRGKSAAL